MTSHEIKWQFFPKSRPCPPAVKSVVEVFEDQIGNIASQMNPGKKSDAVLADVRDGLERLGFSVETGKTSSEKIKVPVLYGPNGKVEKAFEADAYHAESKIVVEVEAGRAYTNYQFLKDLFQACVMQNVDYAVIAVRQDYLGSDDYAKIVNFIEVLYASTRLSIPLDGLLIVGY